MRRASITSGLHALMGIGVAAMGGPSSVAAATICKDAGSRDSDLHRAARLALPIANWLQGDECLYPYALLRYGTADVLITLTAPPGSLCHGCSASLSAFVFRRRPDRPVLVSHFAKFGEAGTNGAIGRIDAIHMDGHDGLAVEHGGTFQGYTSTRLDLYAFEGGRLIHFEPTLPLSADNGGAVEDDNKAISVEGAWEVGGEAQKNVAIEYRIRSGARVGTQRVIWWIDGARLTLKSGRVPQEFTAASGG